MRKTIWLGLAWTLALTATSGCAGRRPLIGDFAGPPAPTKNEWSRTQTKPGAINPPANFPTGGQAAVQKGSATGLGSPMPSMQPMHGGVPANMTSAGGVQQTQFTDERRPIATSMDPPPPLPPGAVPTGNTSQIQPGLVPGGAPIPDALQRGLP